MTGVIREDGYVYPPRDARGASRDGLRLRRGIQSRGAKDPSIPAGDGRVVTGPFDTAALDGLRSPNPSPFGLDILFEDRTYVLSSIPKIQFNLSGDKTGEPNGPLVSTGRYCRR